MGGKNAAELAAIVGGVLERWDAAVSDLESADLALAELERRAARAGDFRPCGDGTSRCQACGFGVAGEVRRMRITLPPSSGGKDT